jgi:hypothetical protein
LQSIFIGCRQRREWRVPLELVKAKLGLCESRAFVNAMLHHFLDIDIVLDRIVLGKFEMSQPSADWEALV